MPFRPLARSQRRLRIVLASTVLPSFMSVRKASALAIAQLGAGAFFVAGDARWVLGDAAFWFILAALLLSAMVRAVDIESWAVFIPGGPVGRARYAFGAGGARLAAAASLTERFLLAALATVVVGHYVAGVAVTALAGWRLTGLLRAEDLALALAAVLIGLLWIRARLGLDLSSTMIARGVWIGVGVLTLIVLWAAISLARGAMPTSLLSPPFRLTTGPWPLDAIVTWLCGFCLVLPAVGGGDALPQGAHELEPPRVQALRRVALTTVVFGLVVTTGGALLLPLLVPAGEQAAWLNAPLAGLTQHLVASSLVRDVMAIALVAAAVMMLTPAAHAALEDADHALRKLSIEGMLPSGLASLHTRLGTAARSIDAAAAAAVLIVLVSGGRVSWLARAYAVSLAVTVVLKAWALARIRRRRTEPLAFKTPFNLQVGAREVPIGLNGVALLAGASAVAMLAIGDMPSITAMGLLGGLCLLFLLVGHENLDSATVEERDSFDLLPSAELSLERLEAKPGNVLVLVRSPHFLGHVVAALQAAGDRDVVVMTVRLLGVDVAEDASADAHPTRAERRLFSEVVALAERYGRGVRLLVVPAHDVFDAIVSTVVRLGSSDVFVGESSSLTTEEQARLLGEAWERSDKPEALDVRLVVLHRTGRSDTYHLGAHPPTFSASDLDLIHRMWLDAVKSVGPHVHHHDVVRAALTQMEQQLTGPERDQALAAIRNVARPADELAAMLRDRDYARLRDMTRNRPAGDLADVLTELNLEDQVIAFRVLPRKTAASVFEYLSQEAKEALLKAMAQEDVAALLNNMAPDERTMFLEELPAAATRQLLGLLTSAERAVALTLLGYPEKSIGRLMTPHYVAVGEHWTVREVLDYVRTHGQDSETLNVIYVVNEQDLLIDDIRIREFLLAPPERKVEDLMDRRFVALKATDDQETAVAAFRQYDRSALPVTDTAGMLIGIVTIDDVLDVAETRATREIQRIGGSEALDEPYMDIAFRRMIQKRAGWLTALFLGEMLTATAMGAFEAEISKAVVLALFVPLIISSGGNSGSQASTLVIRALALGEVGLRDWWSVMRRELLAGLALGGILGSIGFLRITLWSAFSDIYGPHWLLVAATVAIALIGVVLWGTLMGSLLPFVLRRLGFDPAASSAPFVATLVDVTGLVIYFTVALVILRGTLL